MGIGDRVRAAEEERAERTLNEQGKLSGRQLKILAQKGMTPGDAFKLIETGVCFDDIQDIADYLGAQTMQAKSAGADMSAILAQNAAMMEKIVEKARNRRPESYNGDFPFPNISAYNPDGDAKPIPPFKCEFWEGYWDAKEKKAVRDYQFEHDTLDKWEVRLLNLLEPGDYHVTNREDEVGLVRVQATLSESTGAVTQLLIAYPYEWYSRSSQGRKKPGIRRLMTSVLKIEATSNAGLTAWLDAHETKETVAA